MGEKGLSWRALRLERSGRLYSLCGLHYEVMNMNHKGAKDAKGFLKVNSSEV